MTLRKSILILIGAYLLLSLGAYAIFFNTNTRVDELFIAGAFIFLLILYGLVIHPLIKNLKSFSKRLALQSKDDTNELRQASDMMREIVQKQEEASAYINNILSGNFNNEPNAENKLIKDLVNLQTHLSAMLEREKERNWVSEGIADFLSLLREHTHEKDLYDVIISFIIRYLKVNQGGLFLVNDDQTKLCLAGCYAYERKKFMEKEIQIGQGLIGQAYLEKESILLKQIPPNYLTITSGLGYAQPTNILIVPFVVNERVECVIELASFEPFKPYEISFIEKLGESVASTISTLRANDQTTKLLKESQQSAEQMRAQEEELRQNMEELEATQEQMQRKEKELLVLMEKMTESEKFLKEKLDEINMLKEQDEIKNQKMLETIEAHRKMLIQVIDHVPQKIFLKDKDGKFILANSAVAKAHHKTVEELLGTSDFDHFSFEDASEYRNAEIAIMTGGKPVFFPDEIFKDPNGEDRILQTTKIPFYIGHLRQTGLLGIQTDVTEMKQMQQMLSRVQA